MSKLDLDTARAFDVAFQNMKIGMQESSLQLIGRSV